MAFYRFMIYVLGLYSALTGRFIGDGWFLSLPNPVFQQYFREKDKFPSRAVARWIRVFIFYQVN